MSIEIGDGGLGYIYLGDVLIAGKGDSGWKPGANTLLYMPLKSDITDETGKTTTQSGVTFTTVGGVSSAHIGTSGYIQVTPDTFITSGMKQTISCCFYVTSAQTSTRRFLIQFKKTNNYYAIMQIEANTNTIKVLNNNAWGGSGITVVANQWNNVIMTSDGSNRYVYMNGNLVRSGTTNSAWQTTSETSETGDFLMGTPYHNESLNGNCCEFVIENDTRSQEFITKYYNRIKGKLGL